MTGRDLRLPGRAVPLPVYYQREAGEFLGAEVVASYRITAPTVDVYEEPAVVPGLDDQAVVEIGYDDGLQEWVSVGRLAELQAAPEGATLQLAAVVPGDPDRGVGDSDVQSVRIITHSAAGARSPRNVRAAIANVESMLGSPGLYRVGHAGELSEPGELDAEEPYLLLLHGTASNTIGTFGDLFATEAGVPTSEWVDLYRRYGGRVLALHHPTLSESPVDNALDLVAALPPRAELDLVSHSRGGLIGDLLSLGEIPEPAVQRYHDKRRRHADDLGLDEDFVWREIDGLAHLSAVLREKQPHVRRYVRVACPARGTRLAGHPLDKLLSILTNLVRLTPVGPASGLPYQFVKALTLEVARLRANPAWLPGIEAMLPSSPLVYLLNLPELSSSDDLAVIAGDSQPQGAMKRLAMWAGELSGGGAHDLVVHTDAMTGGVRRRGRPMLFFHRGGEVTHVGYFRSGDCRKDLHAWLTREGGATVDGARQLHETRGSAGLAIQRSRPEPEAPTVVLVPTALATHLSVNGTRIWLDAEAIAREGLRSLAPGTAGVRADAVIDRAYHGLVEALSEDFHVQPFAYDWRQGFADSSAGLRAVLTHQLANAATPAHVVAHGTGGLVLWAAVASDPELRPKLMANGGRVVMIGVPDHGAQGILQLLAGGGGLHGALDTLLAEPSMHRADLTALLRTMPGLLGALPASRELGTWWQWLDDADDDDLDEVLEAVQSTQRDIAAAVDRHAGSFLRIAGRATFTPMKVATADGLAFRPSREGDGLALDTEQALGPHTWWAAAANGDLPSRPEVILAVRELLNTGTCAVLNQEPRPAATPAGNLAPWEVLPLFPTDRDLEAAALFATPPVIGEGPEYPHRLTAYVSHGSLEHADGPVLVGHYRGALIAGAETFLDRMLGGRLTSLMALGLYPEDIGTHEVVPFGGIGEAVADLKPPGAIVVGLGAVGKLDRARLTSTVKQAALRYAIQYDEAARRPPGEWRSATISALLVGSSGGRALPIESSIGAITEGVVLANRELRNLGLWDRVRIDRLEFIELEVDRAMRAARVVSEMERYVRLPAQDGDEIYGRPTLQSKPGGRQRTAASEPSSPAWRRLQITGTSDRAHDDGTVDLRFLLLTDRARAEQTTRATQSALIDELVAAAVGGDNGDLVTGALFELLLPNTIKEQSAEPANLQLVLDRVAAAYPWELLTDRARGHDEPLAIRGGILRQLATTGFREGIRSPGRRHALVVGDPDLEGMPRYPQLPGALAEAQRVAHVLTQAGFEVSAVVDGDQTRRRASAVLSRLFDTSKEYSIVHIAAHGRFDPSQADRTGVVIGNDKILTSAEINELRVVPDLVFLNCCDLGQLDASTADGKHSHRTHRLEVSRFAASISEQLIAIGVGAVVAAGWEVEDEAAARFASVFYDRLAGGAALGDAALAARQAAHELGGTTWGAYQIYGSPDFRLVDKAADGAGGAVKMVAAHEYEAALHELAAQTRSVRDPARIEALGKQLDDLVAQMRPDWSTGSVLDALGDCFGALSRLDEAIHYYRMALASPDSGASLAVHDKLLALVASRAVDQLAAAGRPSDAAGAALEDCREAILQVRGLLQVAPTPERHALAGRLYKCLARMAGVDERRELLRKALRAYEDAQSGYARTRAGRRDRPEVWPPYAWNMAVICWLLGRRKESDSQLAGLRDATTWLLGTNAGAEHWTRLLLADAEMLEALMDDSIDVRVEELADAYPELTGGATRSSRTESIDFLLDVLDVTRYGEKSRERMVAALRRLWDVVR